MPTWTMTATGLPLNGSVNGNLSPGPVVLSGATPADYNAGVTINEVRITYTVALVNVVDDTLDDTRGFQFRDAVAGTIAQKVDGVVSRGPLGGPFTNTVTIPGDLFSQNPNPIASNNRIYGWTGSSNTNFQYVAQMKADTGGYISLTAMTVEVDYAVDPDLGEGVPTLEGHTSGDITYGISETSAVLTTPAAAQVGDLLVALVSSNSSAAFLKSDGDEGLFSWVDGFNNDMWGFHQLESAPQATYTLGLFEQVAADARGVAFLFVIRNAYPPPFALHAQGVSAGGPGGTSNITTSLLSLLLAAHPDNYVDGTLTPTAVAARTNGTLTVYVSELDADPAGTYQMFVTMGIARPSIIAIRGAASGPSGPVAKIWNGTDWVTGAKFWNGTEWRADAKIWNGTQWVPFA